MGRNRTGARLSVRVVNKPELLIRVQFDRHLPARLNWAGSQRVVQRVNLEIHITCLLLQFDDSTQSKSIIWHQVTTFCMFCILRDRQYFNSCFSFNVMYFWPGRRSIGQLQAQISIRWLHYPICITSNWWTSDDAELTDILRTAPWPCHLLFCT